MRYFTFATSSGRTHLTRLKVSADPKRLSRGGGLSSGILGVASGYRRRHSPFKLRVADAGAGPARISQPPLRIRNAAGPGVRRISDVGPYRLDLKHAEEPVVCMTLRWRKPDSNLYGAFRVK